MPAVSRVSGLLIMLLALARPAMGQSTETEATARLRDKPLYIRGFWSDRTLHFDGNGDLAEPSPRSSFTLDGFSFRSLKLKDGMLTITGNAVGVEFLKDGPKRVDLPERHRVIQITAPASGDFGPALDAIFADGIDALAPSLPACWQSWARKTYPAAYPSDTVTGQTVTSIPVGIDTKKVGGLVRPPRLVKRVNLQSNDEARALRYSGYCAVHLIVGIDGKPSHLAVFQPGGVGMDEVALAAVAGYQFRPAMESGQPVPVEVEIVVAF